MVDLRCVKVLNGNIPARDPKRRAKFCPSFCIPPHATVERNIGVSDQGMNQDWIVGRE